MDYTERIKNIVEFGVNDNIDREILANSLYYYCCGNDATPIIALYDRCSLYIYVDTIEYGQGIFKEETNNLYYNLERLSFQKKIIFHNDGICLENMNTKPIMKEYELTQWTSKDNQTIYLLYIQGDANLVYRKIYADNNYIQPKYICNLNYEITPSPIFQFERFGGILKQVEKRVEYIMGHCFSDKYKKIGEYTYYGTYGFGEGSVPLYKRIFYYVF